MDIPIVHLVTIGILPGFLKKIVYRLMGAKIGKNVKLGLFTILSSPKIEIGDHARIGHFSIIKVRKSFRIGKRSKIGMFVVMDTGSVDIGDDSIVMEQNIFGGMLSPNSKVSIGDRVKIFPFCFFNPTEPIIIEDDVGIGGANYLFTHGTWSDTINGFPGGFGPIRIKKGAWLQWRIFVAPKVTIEEEAIICAESMVTKSVDSRNMVAGVPAKVIKTSENLVKDVNDDQRNEKLISIFEEYSEFLNYIDIENQINSSVSSSLIQTSRDLPDIHYSRSIPDDLKPKSIYVFLEAPDESQKTKLKQIKSPWFSIDTKETLWTKNNLWLETKNYLSRFGVRFKVIDEL